MIVSHIKQWRISFNKERLDGNNGPLPSPHADKLFDCGYITFTDAGEIVCADSEIEKLYNWKLNAKKSRGRFLRQKAGVFGILSEKDLCELTFMAVKSENNISLLYILSYLVQLIKIKVSQLKTS